jgi:hypothetical protein
MTRPGKFPKDTVSGITPAEWDLLASEFDQLEVGRDVMPHTLGSSIGIDYVHARALLLALGMCGLAENYLYIYHVCSDAPLNARRLSEGFMPLPWTCPNCGHLVTAKSELRYDLACRPRARIRFV